MQGAASQHEKLFTSRIFETLRGFKDTYDLSKFAVNFHDGERDGILLFERRTVCGLDGRLRTDRCVVAACVFSISHSHAHDNVVGCAPIHLTQYARLNPAQILTLILLEGILHKVVSSPTHLAPAHCKPSLPE